MPPKRTIRYRVVKRGSTAVRRLRYRPVFQWALQHTKWFYLLFLVVIPLGYGAILFLERVHTNYYLFTGPKGGTHYLLGPRFADTLNRPDKLERLLHLNVVPDFAPTESCGSRGPLTPPLSPEAGARGEKCAIHPHKSRKSHF